jgi:carbamoyltransferase
MYVLGINAFMHDASAALIHDGKVVAFAEEERFTRVKHAPNSFPVKSIDFCLRQAKINLTDIDHIAYYMNYSIVTSQFWRFQPYFSRMKSKPWRFFGALYMLKKNDEIVKRLAKKAHAKLHFVEHHMAHAAATFFGSGFKKANIITIDGRGELVSSITAVGNNTEIEKISEVPLPHSLGFLYSAVTQFLGFRPNNGEYKVMGLSSYGQDKYRKHFDKIIWTTRDGFKTNHDYYWGHIQNWESSFEQVFYTNKFVAEFGSPKKKDEKIFNNKFEHIAASMQTKTEEVGFHLVNLAHDRTGYNDLCLAGGVALNSKMNGKIAVMDIVDNIYIHPAAHDPGTALGSAYYVHNKITGRRPEPFKHVYHGPGFSNEEIRKYLDKYKIRYEIPSNISARVAELLTKQKVVGWFQGRMEVAPRALGNRSILANPVHPDTKDLVNKCVKNREWWRPFALTILDDYRKDFLVHNLESPFMILVDEVVEEKKPEIAAGIHVDGTTRPQTLKKEINPKYYHLIKALGDHTGTYAVLNTSFNLAGEPIVCTPEEAVKDFFASGMDYLAIGDYLVKK